MNNMTSLINFTSNDVTLTKNKIIIYKIKVDGNIGIDDIKATFIFLIPNRMSIINI